MARISLYRSLAAACVAGVLIMGTGCEDMGKKHETLKQERYNRWNLTRVGMMYQIADQQYKVGDYEKCRQTLKEALALNAPCAPLHTLQAKLEIEKGSLELACDELKEAIRIDSTKPEPFYLMGIVYQRWSKPDVAADYYQQAFDRAPSEAIYLLAVVEMKITLGQLDDAQKLLESKMVYFEQSAAIRVALARIAGLKGDHALACRYYSDAVILMPDDKGIRRSYAEELFFAGKYHDAAAIFEEVRKDPDVTDKSSLLLMLGEAYLNMRRPLDCRNCLQDLVRDDPNNTVAYLELAKACIETNDLNIALAAGEKVLRLEPDNVKAMIVTAAVQQKQRHWAESRTTLENAEKLAPKDATVLCMLGISFQELGKKDDAISYYQRALDANPKDTWAAQLIEKVRSERQSKAEPVTPTPVAAPAPAASAAVSVANQVSTATGAEPADTNDEPQAP